MCGLVSVPLNQKKRGSLYITTDLQEHWIIILTGIPHRKERGIISLTKATSRDYCAMQPQDIHSMNEGYSVLDWSSALYTIIITISPTDTVLQNCVLPECYTLNQFLEDVITLENVVNHKMVHNNELLGLQRKQTSCLVCLNRKPKSKLKHLITITSLNAVIITSWWYLCTRNKHARCAISSADVCDLQPLSTHTVPVILVLLYGRQLKKKEKKKKNDFSWIFGWCGLYFFSYHRRQERKRGEKWIIREKLEGDSEQKQQGSST